jgi:organic hydroperoxide reductase OsmC/OhrA
VAALVSCHMLSFLALAARAGVLVLADTDAAEGTMTFESGHGQFARVVLRPRVLIAEGSDPDLAHRPHEACFIARSVNFPVTHEASIEVVGGSSGSRSRRAGLLSVGQSSACRPSWIE